MKIRSNFAITRLLVLPYTALLSLYLGLVGGGGLWLYAQVRNSATEGLVDDLTGAVAPLVARVRTDQGATDLRDGDPWLKTEVEHLLSRVPALRAVSVRGAVAGVRLAKDGAGSLSTQPTAPLSEQAMPTGEPVVLGRRLDQEDDPEFVIAYPLEVPAGSPARLEFVFDRPALLRRVDEGMVMIQRSLLVFIGAGALSILVALAITAMAMRVTRRLESHFQEMYQRASLTETAARLVHDLRNPLAALRANVKALLVAPQETEKIISDMDRDILALNDKLTAFLDLTRRRGEAIVPVDVAELIGDAVRLAEPAVANQGLSIETDIAGDLPRPAWQPHSLRDALFNLILNASQSGQRQGSIRITARTVGAGVEIAVEDRGAGIAKEHLPHLFEAFYTTRDDGNGLGLAIVERIVANHQGRVRAENRPGGGARFVLTLPLQRQETPRWWTRFQKASPA